MFAIEHVQLVRDVVDHDRSTRINTVRLLEHLEGRFVLVRSVELKPDRHELEAISV